MTLPLWMLLGFASWTLTVLVFGVGVRRWLLIFRGEAAINGFPGDTIHGSPAYRRATRAHANCVENLPVFAAIVLIGAAAHLHPPDLDGLSIAVMSCRVVQTTIHLSFPESQTTVAFRFSFFFVQVAAMFAMAALTATAALNR